MLQIQFIRENREFVIERLQVKNFDAKEIVANIIDIDSKRREAQIKSDELLSKLNLLSKEIAPLLNISLRGVEISRYRLRKKLGLEEGENLAEFLQRFNK